MKIIHYLFACMALIFCLPACEVKYDGKDINYRFTMNNMTAGYIQNVFIDAAEYGDMTPDQSQELGFKYRPDEIKITYETDKIYNLGIDFAAQLREYYFVTEEKTKTGTYDLILEETHFSLWVVNDCTDDSVDRIGYNLPDGADANQLTSYGDYLSSEDDTVASPGETIWLGFHKKTEIDNFYLLDVSGDGLSASITGGWKFDPIDGLYAQDTPGIGTYTLRLSVNPETKETPID